MGQLSATRRSWGLEPVVEHCAPGPALIYALGGGRGHLARALCLARRLPMPTTIVHCCSQPASGVPAHVRLVLVPPGNTPAQIARTLDLEQPDARLIVVDTFPAGVGGEIPASWSHRNALRVLVKRYVRAGSYADYDDLADCYDVHWEPYPAHACEWEGFCTGAHLGWCTRSLVLEQGREVDVLVIGDPTELPTAFQGLLPADTVYLRGDFSSLPRARRILCLGAGYNLAYELRSLGLRPGFIPLERRFDDQYRRAGLAGVPLLSRDHVRRFLFQDALEVCGAA